MRVDGVLVDAAACERFGPLVDLLVRRAARQDGLTVDFELDALLRELVAAGLAHRARASVPASVPGPPRPAVAGSASMSANELAGRWGVTPSRVRQRARAGELGHRQGGRWQFTPEEAARA